MAAVNPIRGEVEASIGSLSIVMVVDMQSLARLSAASSCGTLAELYHRMHGTELAMVLLALEHFTTRGIVDGRVLKREEAVSQALARLTIDDVHDLQGPFTKLLAALLRKQEGHNQGNVTSAQNQ